MKETNTDKHGQFDQSLAGVPFFQFCLPEYLCLYADKYFEKYLVKCAFCRTNEHVGNCINTYLRICRSA